MPALNARFETKSRWNRDASALSVQFANQHLAAALHGPHEGRTIEANDHRERA